jgi:hypothetical protein
VIQDTRLLCTSTSARPHQDRTFPPARPRPVAPSKSETSGSLRCWLRTHSFHGPFAVSPNGSAVGVAESRCVEQPRRGPAARPAVPCDASGQQYRTALRQVATLRLATPPNGPKGPPCCWSLYIILQKEIIQSSTNIEPALFQVLCKGAKRSRKTEQEFF